MDKSVVHEPACFPKVKSRLLKVQNSGCINRRRLATEVDGNFH
jgi:hypothetical protein